ncbi:uncharacterized protein LOC108148225 isoform X2 [Drosophila elegans]|uniref:uncharacterized protein LOC108148225 isoform X2 n=1 Tax=Drosophila elegans TaxID=30023 RepID=UPI001BC84484|nr:uncharacterized protein LOC108148225 isoform X2 [Drosophila elegans]
MYRRLRDTAEVKRIQALKALFKKVIRMVSLNNPWKDSDDDHKVTSYVKRNISTRVRARPRTGFLTAAEKIIIRTPHVRRTIPDRMKLCTLFAKLRCLTCFTPKLRARLVPVLRLMPVDAGRTIIRQSDVPITVFFVISGEVHMIEDNDMKDELVKGILGPGDMMGDVELIEGIKRTCTFRAATYCELLVLFDYDFVRILGPHMTKIWDEKKRALKALDYFDFLDDDQIVEACRFGRLKQFHPLDTIYCDDIGSMTNVHFVLSGECLILQCLNMSVSVKKGKKVFQLMPTAAGDVSKMFRQGVRSTMVSPSKSENLSKIDIVGIVESSSTSSKENEHNSTLNRTMRKMQLRDIEKACGLVKSLPTPKPRITLRRSNQKSNITVFSETENDFIYEDIYENFWEICEDEDDIEISSSDTEDLSFELRAPFHTSPVVYNKDESDQNDSDFCSSSCSRSTSSSNCATTPVVESHFIDVGTLTFGGIFGLGETMEHRVIMARTTVQCLTLPRFFLLEKKQNPGNIWERRLLYMDCMIPSREALFAHYLKVCDWKKFKNDFIRESLKPSDNDVTHVGDIPIICKIVETSDDVE